MCLTFGTRYDIINLRGFTPQPYHDDLRIGTYYYTQPKINLYLLERTDIIKGLEPVLYKQTPPGSVINYVFKRPTLEVRNDAFNTKLGHLNPSFVSNDRNQSSSVP